MPIPPGRTTCAPTRGAPSTASTTRPPRSPTPASTAGSSHWQCGSTPDMPTTSSALTRSVATSRSSGSRLPPEAGIDQDLGVPRGSGEIVEGGLDAVQPDGAGDQRRRVDGALGDHLQRVVELGWVVGED